MTIHTMPKHTCPSCGGEGEYLGALLDMSGKEEREYLFWKCLDCRQMWQTKKERGVSP
jgi:DNA-directed RNA polymerase subunit M/transcription elongation factor TFIIS